MRIAYAFTSLVYTVKYLILALIWVVCIFSILASSKDTKGKVGWALVVTVFPVAGAVACYFLGRDTAKNSIGAHP